MIVNLTNDYPIMINMYPIGAVFNGSREYNLTAKNPILNRSPYIWGIQDTLETTSPNYVVKANFDDDRPGQTGGCKFSVGFGLYKIEFWKETFSGFGYNILVDTCYMDWRDGGFYQSGHFPPGFGNADLKIEYHNDTTIGFKYNCCLTTFVNITTVNRHIKFWELIGTEFEGEVTPLKGAFFSSDLNYYTLHYPINAKDKVYERPLDVINHINAGDVSLNLKIINDVYTRDTLISNPTIIRVTHKTNLSVAFNKTINIIPPLSGFNNLIIDDSASMTLYDTAKIFVHAPNKITFKPTSYIRMARASEIVLKPGAVFCNEGATIIGPGKIIFEKGLHPYCVTVADFIAKDSTNIILSDSAVLELRDDFTLRLSGIKSSLILNPHSKIKFGENSKILLDSGATLIANNAEFSSSDTSKKWEGIVLSNSGVDSIISCSFSNAKTALTITNNSNYSSINRVIKNNTFNIPNGGVSKGIYGENNYRILIQNNVFNMPVYFPSGSPVLFLYVGLYLKNSSTGGAAGEQEGEEPSYSLNIVDNTFSNGCASVILANYLSNLLPYNISKNTFNNTASVNLIGIKINGAIKNNNFTSNDVPLGIHLVNSSPDMFNNSIESKDVSLHLSGHCYPNLAPYVSGSDLVWAGGNNSFSTEDQDNIQLSSSGNVTTDFGNNNFNIANSSSYHIYGWLDSTQSIYYSRENCWNTSGSARIYLKEYGSTDTIPEAYISTSNYDCSSETSPESWDVTYKGNGIYDSVKISEDNTGGQPSEAEILNAQAINEENNGFHTEAIIDYKYLLDNYPGYTDAPDVLYDLYGCYQSLDTNIYIDYRGPLYQNIIDYLSEKILSEEYENNSEFCDNAYDIILMGYTILEVQAAAGGYEFLSFNHPDPNIRLAASWNYEEIEALIEEGEGGGERNLEFGMSDLEFEKDKELQELKELERLNEIIRSDPVMSKMKKRFDRESVERKQKIEKQIRSSKDADVKEALMKSDEFDKIKEDRAKDNILLSKSLSNEEKLKRRLEDISLSTIDIRNISGHNSLIKNIPLEYKLSQNYPNPFNPSTTISYELPFDGLVKINVYDISGREVKTLVNEFRTAGSYNVIFDGINLASGVYFCKLESNKFVETKRMVLIK